MFAKLNGLRDFTDEDIDVYYETVLTSSDDDRIVAGINFLYPEIEFPEGTVGIEDMSQDFGVALHDYLACTIKIVG